MLRILRQWRAGRIIRRHPVDEALWRDILAITPILGDLGASEKARLKDLTALFLHEKVFLPVQELVLTPSMRVLIAAQACYPILNLDFDYYSGWRTVIVYPGQFLRPRREVDSIGVMHEWTEVLQGESWEHGPVIFSWADVEGSGLGDGYNVIIHEMAHKLDMLNGDADGFPPLHRTMSVPSWTRSFTAAFDDLNASLDRGEQPPIDPYAAESPAEYFAVLSEYFFERPDLIQVSYPEVYQRLAEFYRQDPAARLRSQKD